MTKFNVGDELKFLDETNSFFTKGKKYKVIKIYKSMYSFIDDKGNTHNWDFDKAHIAFRKSASKNQRITALENEVAELRPLKQEVAELKLIVHELRERPQLTTVINNATQGPSTITVEDIIEFEGAKYRKVERKAREGDVVVFRNQTNNHIPKNNTPYLMDDDECIEIDTNECCVYSEFHNRTLETVDVYELIESKPLTPNQQRAAIIEKAKQFVEEQKQEFYGSKMYQVGGLMCDADFQINQGKRAITCLIKHKYKGLVSKGIAKCNPTDVFNEHIEKAIALGRALGLDVSEFEQAAQPTKPEYGMIVLPLNPKDGLREVSQYYVPSKTCHLGSDTAKYGKILNDTNAKYEVF